MKLTYPTFLVLMTVAILSIPQIPMAAPLDVVDQIQTVGTRLVPESSVRSWLVTRTGMPPDSLLLRNDIDRILKRYREEGFWQASVGFSTLQANGKVSVKFQIREGNRTRLNSIQLSGNRVIPTEELVGLTQWRQGAEVRQSTLESDLESILKYYENRGYPFCSLNPDLGIVPGIDDARLEVVIHEGPFVEIDTVIFRGAKVTRNEVLQREIQHVVGRPYSQKRVDEAIEGLRRLPFVLSVEGSDIEQSEARSSLVVWMREAHGTRLEAGIGYAPGLGGTGQGITGAFSLAFENLLGSGRSGQAIWSRKGQSSTELSLSYREPWIFGLPLSAGIRLGIQQRVGFTEGLLSGDLRWKMSRNASVGVGLTRFGVKPDSAGIGEILPSETWMVDGSIRYDSRDDSWNPRKGTNFKGHLSLGRVDRGCEFAVRRSYRLDVDRYQPTGSRSLVAVGLHGGQVRQGKHVPAEVRMHLGGIETIRGYREETFLATLAVWSNLEWRWLLGLRSRGFFFLDFGYLQDLAGGKKIHAYPIAYGAGLRMDSQLGIIGFDYGLAKGDSPGQGKVHLQMVNEF